MAVGAAVLTHSLGAFALRMASLVTVIAKRPDPDAALFLVVAPLAAVLADWAVMRTVHRAAAIVTLVVGRAMLPGAVSSAMADVVAVEASEGDWAGLPPVASSVAVVAVQLRVVAVELWVVREGSVFCFDLRGLEDREAEACEVGFFIDEGFFSDEEFHLI